MINSYSFLSIGKTQESKETTESFKKYVGIGSSYVVAVNPTKKELETLYGHEIANAPEYVVDGEHGKEARVTFIVKTNPETCNGVEILNRVTFTLRNTPAYNRDETKVQVIDQYGNTTWANVEDAKAGKKLLSEAGNNLRIDDSYRMAAYGEPELVNFLKIYLGVGNAFDYINGSWVKKDTADECVFGLEKVKDYFKGDFSEIKEAIALQPNNRVKLLYGVRTADDNKQYQTVCTRLNMVLYNGAGSRAYENLEKELERAKQNGAFPNTVFSNSGNSVKDLEEFVLTPTDLSSPATSSSSTDDVMPWD